MARSGFGIALSRPPLSRQPRPPVLRREPGCSRGGGKGRARPRGESPGANPVLLTLGPRTAKRNTVAMSGVLTLNFAVELNGGANRVLHPDCLWVHLVRGAGLAISQPPGQGDATQPRNSVDIAQHISRFTFQPNLASRRPCPDRARPRTRKGVPCLVASPGRRGSASRS